MKLTFFKFAAATASAILIAGAANTLIPAMAPSDARIEDHPTAFWCLMLGIVIGLAAGAFDILEKMTARLPLGADRDS